MSSSSSTRSSVSSMSRPALLRYVYRRPASRLLDRSLLLRPRLLTLVFGTLLLASAPADAQLNLQISAGNDDDSGGEASIVYPAVEDATDLWWSGRDSDARTVLQDCLTEGGAAAAAAAAAAGAIGTGGGGLEQTADMVTAACQAALGEMDLVGAAGGGRNFSKALDLFESASSVGDPDAQYGLGILHASMLGATSLEDAKRHEALAVLHFYAASTAGHPGALMAMGYRHFYGYGVPQSCSAAALNYINVAKRVANIYSEGMPQAVQLIRLNLNQKDRKVVSSSEMNLFVQIASNGDAKVAAGIGKRYLLGIEGFKQDYGLAKYYLDLAANDDHPGAKGLLGYIYCLGLGIEADMETAFSYFTAAAQKHDALGHNGLGYIHFKGSPTQPRDLKQAFKHFNESALRGSADGMFNLASMYLTGSGTVQSFPKAVLFYTQALDRGHTPAAYSLAVMHLNGIGTVQNCEIAVNLLKRVCERGDWVSSRLTAAHSFSEQDPDKAAWNFVKLAEAGHEVAQMNAAHLFDTGQSTFLLPEVSSSSAEAEQPDERNVNRILAQRYYEMSAEQGSVSSELRLGDFAYYGWGIAASFKGDNSSDQELITEDGVHLPNLYTSTELEVRPQVVDYEAAIARYQKTAESEVTGEWMQGFVARGSFNLGFMHQFGLGVPQDLQKAKQHYNKCKETDPAGLQLPVTIVLAGLTAHHAFLRFPTTAVLMERLFADFRVHVLVLHLIGIVVLLVLSCRFNTHSPPRGGARSRRRRTPAASDAASASDAAAASMAATDSRSDSASATATATASRAMAAAASSSSMMMSEASETPAGTGSGTGTAATTSGLRRREVPYPPYPPPPAEGAAAAAAAAASRLQATAGDSSVAAAAQAASPTTTTTSPPSLEPPASGTEEAAPLRNAGEHED